MIAATGRLRWIAVVVLSHLLGSAAAPAAIIVDNDDPGFSVLPGTSWSTAGRPDYFGEWGDDYRWKNTSDPAGEVEWRPTILQAGDYEVAVWYRSTGSGRPDDAHYRVHRAGGVDDVFVNQQINGSRWVVLGTYPFAAGTAGMVTLSSTAQPGKTIVADAVRFRSLDEAPSPAFRGFWADAFHAGFKSAAQIDAMVSRAVEGNYNAIVAEVLAYHDTTGGGHGAYWNSAIVPKADDIVGGIDPLAYLVQQAHAAGLEVDAWLVTYRVSTSWPPSDNELLAAHPEWIMVPQLDLGGGPATIDGKYTLDPGSPDVQEYLIGIVRELVGGYAIDGINWDYIRYTQTDAGYPADAAYDNSGLARFQRITGYAGTPPPSGEASWNDFRRRTIDELVRRCRAEIPAIDTNPSQPLRLTADLIAFGDAPASFSGADAYLLHQNWRHWMEMGWLDAGMPMNYKREHVGSHAQWYRNWIDAAIGWRYDRHMYCGQGNYLNSMGHSLQQLWYGIDAGADGSMNYSYYATADEDMDGSEENDWGWYDYVSGNLFQSPVPIPMMPWRESATAAEGTLWGRVTEYDSGLPIDDATVQVAALSPVQTDGNGFFVVTLIPATASGTEYDVTVTASGFPPMTRTGVTVVAGDVRRRDAVIGAPSAGPGDMDEDGDIDLTDLGFFAWCLQGPGVAFAEGHVCLAGDADGDRDIDSRDFASFQGAFTGPLNGAPGARVSPSKGGARRGRAFLDLSVCRDNMDMETEVDGSVPAAADDLRYRLMMLILCWGGSHHLEAHFSWVRAIRSVQDGATARASSAVWANW